jgi:hypothetical protein
MECTVQGNSIYRHIYRIMLRIAQKAREAVAGGDKDVHSASLRAWRQTAQFARGKLRPPGYEHIIAKGNYVRCLVMSCHAQGIPGAR